MKPGSLILLGATIGIVSVIIAAVARDAAHVAVLLFVAGSIFGKGYGVWEERTGRDALGTERGEE